MITAKQYKAKTQVFSNNCILWNSYIHLFTTLRVWLLSASQQPGPMDLPCDARMYTQKGGKNKQRKKCLWCFDSNASMPVWFQSSGRGYGWWAAASPLGWWTSLIDDTCNNSERGGPQAKCMSGGTHQHLLQSSCWSTLSGRQEHQGCQFSLDRQPTCTTCVQNKIRQTINIMFFMCLFSLNFILNAK